MVNDEKCRGTSAIHHSPFTILNGDKIDERLALVDEAGIEPALTMYSASAFAKANLGFQSANCEFEEQS